jgi:hypothetical protein
MTAARKNRYEWIAIVRGAPSIAMRHQPLKKSVFVY